MVTMAPGSVVAVVKVSLVTKVTLQVTGVMPVVLEVMVREGEVTVVLGEADRGGGDHGDHAGHDDSHHVKRKVVKVAPLAGVGR